MNIYKLLFIVSIIGVVFLVGYVGIQAAFLNQGSLDTQVNQQQIASCESQLQSMESIMIVNQTREIPDSCFVNGEIITDRLPNATPEDEFRKTSNGIEVVPN